MCVIFLLDLLNADGDSGMCKNGVVYLFVAVDLNYLF